MKKIKKLIVIALATTMLLGATLTVHAAPATPTCTSCGLTGPVKLDRVLYENGKPYLYEWSCQYCYNHFTTYAH